MKILAKPVYNILKELLDKHDLKDVTQWEEATEVFRKNLFNVVLLLSDTDEVFIVYLCTLQQMVYLPERLSDFDYQR